MKLSMTFTGFLILAAAGLCLGQTAQQPSFPGQKAEKQKTTAGKVKMDPKMMIVRMEDSMQCIMRKSDELSAAYTEAQNSGCKKVKAGQWSEYYCGMYDSAECAKCKAASQKIKAILDGCRIKPPQHTPPPPDGLGIPNDVPGCNSLGIDCACDNPPPS